jgi:transcriptional regulator with XRE-family HTH domain
MWIITIDCRSIHHEVVMLTLQHLRAARALLKLSQQELAQAAGVHLNVIANFESGQSQPRQTTLQNIQQVLTDKGLVLSGASGVALRTDAVPVRQYSGPDFMRQLTDDVLATIATPQDEVCVVVHDDRLFQQADARESRRYYRHKQATHFRDRILLPVGATHFLGKTTLYRFVPPAVIGETSWLVYGDKVCHIVWAAHTALVLEQPALAGSFRGLFQFLWGQAKPMA